MPQFSIDLASHRAMDHLPCVRIRIMALTVLALETNRLTMEGGCWDGELLLVAAER
jgi:hypothetical protein